MFAAFLFGSKENYSEREKRALADAPTLNWSELMSGSFGAQAEDYAADHIFGRDFFIELNAYFDALSNLQVTKEIYVSHDGRLYESPCQFDSSALERCMTAVNAFAAAVGSKVDLMLVPSAGYLMQDEIQGLANPYVDDKLISYAYSLAGDNVSPIDILSNFSACALPQQLYYATDHHWTSLGAYTAYAKYMECLGKACPSPEDYSVTEVPGFHGSTYSRACFWELPSECVELWDSGGDFTVSFSEADEEYNSLFFPDRLEEADKYLVYLNGNHPLVRITNNSPFADGKILVIRDSYANCMGCFLADSYKEVVLADLRYYKQPLSELCTEEDFDNILIVYYASNFMEDSNIAWLN